MAQNDQAVPMPAGAVPETQAAPTGAVPMPQGAVPITPQAVPAPEGALTAPIENPYHRGFEQGVAAGFGLTPPDPNNPHTLTFRNMASQTFENLKRGAQESFHRLGGRGEDLEMPKGMGMFTGPSPEATPRTLMSLAAGAATPIDMLVNMPMAISNLWEQGQTEAWQGFKSGDKEMMSRGFGKVFAAWGQMFAASEKPGGRPGIVSKAGTKYRQFVGQEIPAENLYKVPPAAEFQPALGVTPAEVIREATRTGVDLTRAQGTKMPVARMAQALGERSLFGANKLVEGLDRNASAFMKAVRTFSDEVDPRNNGLSLEEAGEAIRKETEAKKQISHNAANAGYGRLGDNIDAIVNTEDIQKDWTKNRADMQVVLDNAPKEIASKIDAVLKKASDLGTTKEVTRTTGPTIPGFEATSQVPETTTASVVVPELTFGDAIKLRSFFRQMGDTIGADLPRQYQALYKQLTENLDHAMEKTAKEQGFENTWRDANAGWKRFTANYGEPASPLYRILDQLDPSRIAKDLIARRSVMDIKMLRGEGMTDSLQALKRQVIEEVARNKFNVGKNGLGGFTDDYLSTLFSTKELRELYTKAEIGRRFNWQMNPSGTSNVMVGESQLVHPTPTKLALLYGAAKESMPQPATNFLPRSSLSIPLRSYAIGALSEGKEKENQQ